MNYISISKYLELAFLNGLMFKRSWRIQMICQLDTYKEDPYYPRPSEDGAVFTDEEGEVILIKDTPKSGILFPHKSTIILDPLALPNVATKTTTRYGLWLINSILTAPWGDRIPYINEPITPKLANSVLGGALVSGVIDKVTEGAKLKQVIADLDTVVTSDLDMIGTAAKREMFSENKEKAKVRDVLLKKYEGQLDDPIIQTKIAAEISKVSKDWYASMGAQDFVIKDKIHDVVLSKTEGAYGSETNLDGKPTKFVKTNLEEGIKPEDLPSYINSARAGSFGRGGLTAQAGALVNIDYLVTSGLVGVKGDCKTKEGVWVNVYPENYTLYAGQALVGTDKYLSSTDLKEMIGKRIHLRVPGGCKFPQSTYCTACGGESINTLPESIPTRTSLLDSTMMDAFMQATHGKQLKTQVVDLKKYLT